MGFYSEVSQGYQFSNQTMESKGLPLFLKEIINVINTTLGTQFNAILVNYYRNGEDNLGAHADNEKGLYNGMVAAVTLMNSGGTRKFRVRDYFTNEQVITISTKHNQLLVMGGNFQKSFKHEVPVEKSNKNAERISLTFRYHTV